MFVDYMQTIMWILLNPFGLLVMSKPVDVLQKLMNVKVIRARMEPTVPMVWTSFTVTVHQDGLGHSVLSVSNKQRIVIKDMVWA